MTPHPRPFREVFQRLHAHHGPQNWWPGCSALEIVVGAVLTQRVAWRNAERAVAALKASGWLSAEQLAALPVDRLAQRITPALHYNQKALRLQALAGLLVERFGGDLDRLLALDIAEQREILLSIRGIGPETADAIILYAAAKPSFVIDAYTRRIFSRLGMIRGNERYDALRAMFMDRLPQETQRYQEAHALMVIHGRTFCTKRDPRCPACPLGELCRHAEATATRELDLHPLPGPAAERG